jgi:hypothetical protein
MKTVKMILSMLIAAGGVFYIALPCHAQSPWTQKADIPTDCGITLWVKIQCDVKPPERAYHAMAYDSESDRVILFAGQKVPQVPTQLYSDTWAYDANSNTWTDMNPTISPPSTAGHTLCYDSESDRIILIAGPNYISFKTWAYDYNSNTWINLEPSSKPSARFGYNMAYDVESDRIILFGGYGTESLGDTWVFNFNKNTWTEMKPLTGPHPRLYHSMAYDTESDRVILFGGGYTEGGVGSPYTTRFNDTWAYDYNANTWTEMMPDTCPSARVYTDIIYHNRCDRIVLFGGGTQSFYEPNPNLNYGRETWFYDFNTNSWEKMNLKNRPPNRKKHKLAYDSESDHFICFGGDVWDGWGDTVSFQNELWMWYETYAAIEQTNIHYPFDFSLSQNYPNPFNPSTTIRYTILKSCPVTLAINDMLGREILTLVNETQTPGEYSVTWNGQGHPGGLYICRLRAGNFIETRKLVLQK